MIGVFYFKDFLTTFTVRYGGSMYAVNNLINIEILNDVKLMVFWFMKRAKSVEYINHVCCCVHCKQIFLCTRNHFHTVKHFFFTPFLVFINQKPFILYTVNHYSLKTVCHEMYDLYFLQDSNPSRSLINIFSNSLLICRDNQILRNSAVCIILQSGVNLRGVRLCCVHHTAESNCTPQSQKRTFLWSLVAFKGTIRRNPFRL